MRTLIEVTNKDIKAGKKRIFPPSKHCPIAGAINRTLGINFAKIGLSMYSIDDGNTYIKLSRSAQRFINKFDDKKPVKPFRFFIEA